MKPVESGWRVKKNKKKNRTSARVLYSRGFSLAVLKPKIFWDELDLSEDLQWRFLFCEYFSCYHDWSGIFWGSALAGIACWRWLLVLLIRWYVSGNGKADRAKDNSDLLCLLVPLFFPVIPLCSHFLKNQLWCQMCLLSREDLAESGCLTVFNNITLQQPDQNMKLLLGLVN